MREPGPIIFHLQEVDGVRGWGRGRGRVREASEAVRRGEVEEEIDCHCFHCLAKAFSCLLPCLFLPFSRGFLSAARGAAKVFAGSESARELERVQGGVGQE